MPIVIAVITLALYAALVVAPFFLLSGFFAVTGAVLLAILAGNNILLPLGKRVMEVVSR